MAFKIGIALPVSSWTYYEKISDGSTVGNLLSVSAISVAYNPEDRTFEASGWTIRFGNANGYWDTLLNGTDRNIVGASVNVWSDTTLIALGQVRSILESTPDEFVIQCDYKTGGADLEMNTRLLKSSFASIPAQNEGQWKNILRGYVDDTGGSASGMLIAYRIAANNFYIGPSYAQVACYSVAGVDITASCAYDNVTGLIAYVSSDDYILVCYYNSTYPQPCWQLRQIAPTYHGVFENLDGAFEILTAQGHFDNMGCSLVGGVAMAIIGQKTYRDWWVEMANNFDFFVYPYNPGVAIASDMYMYCDYAALWQPSANYTAAAMLYATDIIPNSYQNYIAPQPLECFNAVAREYWYHYFKGYFQRMPQDIELASDWTAQNGYEDLRYIKHEQLAFKYAMRKLFFRNKPHFYCAFEVPLSKLISWGIMNLGKILRLNYPLGYFRNTERVLKIVRLAIMEETQTARIVCLDLSHVVAKLDAVDLRLYIVSHTSNGDAAFLDFSPLGQHVITAAGTMVHSTAWGKFHKSSMLGDGNSDYLTVPDSPDWDLMAAANPNVTIHFWCKTPAVLNAATNETLIGQYVDGTHRWELNHQYSTHFMRLLINGVATTSAIAFAASTVYHIAICKVSNNLGVYVNGALWIYKDMTGIDTSLAEVLYVAARVTGGAPSTYCNWYFDEIAVAHKNIFSAAPDAGLLNTITVPTKALTWEG